MRGSDVVPVLKKYFQDLIKQVVDLGLCTGCGMCAGVCPPRQIVMSYGQGEPRPELRGTCTGCGICLQTCPGAFVPLEELDKFTFGRSRGTGEDETGIFIKCVQGYANDPIVREASSCGGAVTAICQYALDEGVIDIALLAGFSNSSPWHCVPLVARSSDEFSKLKANSAYVMVPVLENLSKAVAQLKAQAIGIVCLPCQVHGLRKLQHFGKPVNIARRIKFVIGLFCAATNYATGTEHYLTEICGLKSIEDVSRINYREGQWPGKVVVETKAGERLETARDDFLYGWLPSCNFRRDRCLVCTDFSSELGDLSAGDTYLPREGNKRWTALVVRTKIGEQLLQGAMSRGYVTIEDYDAANLPASGYGWEAKKHANVQRLAMRKKNGWPTPDFGVSSVIRPVRRRLYRARG